MSTVTLSVTEHLEAEEQDGSSSMLVATGGTDLLDDLADLLSFGLDAVFSRDGDLVKRLVSSSLDTSNRSAAARLFRRTFEPNRYLKDPELDEIRRLMENLLGLQRARATRRPRSAASRWHACSSRNTAEDDIPGRGAAVIGADGQSRVGSTVDDQAVERSTESHRATRHAGQLSQAMRQRLVAF